LAACSTGKARSSTGRRQASAVTSIAFDLRNTLGEQGFRPSFRLRHPDPNWGQVNRIDGGPARPSGGWLREVDVETVRRDGWKDLLPADPDGVEKISKAVVSADGQGHADFHTPRLSDLFAAEGFEQTRPLPSVRPSS
jgi:hypothetical protein